MFYFLNRCRGTWAWFAKVEAIIFGVLFGFVTQDIYIGGSMAILFLAGESMGWGDWVGQQCGSPLQCGNEGENNGIKWIASKFAPCGTDQYNKIALVIRGFYWWMPTLAPLMFVLPIPIVLLAVIALSFGFQISLDWASGTGSTKWANAEYNYGGIQDVVISILLVSALLVTI